MASGEEKKTKPAATKVEELTYRQVATVAAKPAWSSVPLNRIIVGERLRPAEPDAVAALAVSMNESGQEALVTVRPIQTGQPGQWYKLVTGGHRYAAAQLLGWSHIDATIRDLTDAQALLVEIDENLLHRQLTAYERAVFIEARLRAWAEVHPDRVTVTEAGEVRPKRGRPANSTKVVELLGDTPPLMGFAASTAADLDISEMTVKNALLVVRGLSGPVHEKIRGTILGRNEGLLRQIAGVADKAEQLKVVEALSDGRAKSFSDALVVASGRTPVRAPERPLDTSLKAFQKAWKDAPASHRVAMLRWLSEQHLGPFDLVEIGSRAR